LVNAAARWRAERTKLTMPGKKSDTETSQAHATSTEFCRVFKENMDSMHLLSFLLTADHRKAEECFVSGLEDCVKGSYVFRGWARSWAQRTIIQNAVRMLAPRANHSAASTVPINRRFGRTQEADAAIASILGLEDFERFVFVMSVLERYSDQDCSVLLRVFAAGCPGDKNASLIACRWVRQATHCGRVRGPSPRIMKRNKRERTTVPPMLVIGFVGGFVHREDLPHSETQIAPQSDEARLPVRHRS
jgi:hypothetical protein